AQIFLRFFNKRDANILIHVNNTNEIKIYKYIFIAAISLIFIFFVFQSFQQYWVWAGNELSKNLLPPYQNINYFLFYVFTRFFAPYLISLGAALIFLFSTKILNKKSGERFFYPGEIYIGASAIFLTSHPGWLFYVVFLIIIYLIIHLYSLFIIHNSFVRVSLYWLWIPTAIIVIILMNWLQTLPWWGLLKI
ncbi:MAG: hypothetical protein ABIH10_01315, partial [Spirochaetota bacterium]